MTTTEEIRLLTLAIPTLQAELATYQARLAELTGEATEPKRKRKPGRPAGSANKPKGGFPFEVPDQQV